MQKYDREFKIIITKVPNYGKRAKHVPCENFHREKIVNMPDANLKAETYGNRMKNAQQWFKAKQNKNQKDHRYKNRSLELIQLKEFWDITQWQNLDLA